MPGSGGYRKTIRNLDCKKEYNIFFTRSRIAIELKVLAFGR